MMYVRTLCSVYINIYIYIPVSAKIRVCARVYELTYIHFTFIYLFFPNFLELMFLFLKMSIL